jgi:general nucleoside transport system permease protein
MTLFYGLVVSSLIFATPIIITALGGLFSERSGIVNIGLEGLMMFGGFTAAAMNYYLEDSIGFLAPIIGMILGAIVGGIVSLIHAYVCINLKGDQTISGTAINLLAPGLTIFLAQILFHQQRTPIFKKGIPYLRIPFLKDIPFIGPILFGNIRYTVYIGVVLIFVVYYFISNTRFGLRLKACGEHPSAADSMGVNVAKMRYFGVVLSGILAGLSGGVYVLVSSTQFTVTTIGGLGFIALAALIFGKWSPFGVLGAGIIFGVSRALGTYAPSIAFLNNLPLEFYYTLPYLLTLVALVIFSKNQVGPRAAGTPYEKGLR